MTKVSQRNDWLDVCRATAVLGVVFCHGIQVFPQQVFRLPQFLAGFFGVEIFFCLSGFLIGSIIIDTVHNYSGETGRIWNFMVRRWLRTLPNYYFWMAMNVAVFYYIGWPIDDTIHLWVYAVFLQNLLWVHPSFFPEAWSLAVEEVFYFLFPLVFLLIWSFTRRWVTALIGAMFALILLSMALRLHAALHTVDWSDDICKVVLLRLDSLMIGVSLALLHRKIFPDRPLILKTIGFVLLCFLPFAVYISALGPDWLNTHFIAKFWLFTILSLGICGAISTGLDMHIPSPVKAATGLVARWSYSIYLANKPAAYLVFHFFGAGTNNLERTAWFAAFFLLTMAFAGVTYNLVERPILKLRDRYVRGAHARVDSKPTVSIYET